MAQYFTDWSEYTTDAQPNDWTARFVTSGITWLVRAVAGATGGKVLESVNTTDGRKLLSWDAIDADADRDDGEIVYKWRCTSGLSTLDPECALRASGTHPNQSLYRFGPNEPARNGINITKYVGGSVTPIADTPITFALDTWYWARARVNGANSGTVQLKHWQDGDPEPGTWNLTDTDSDIDPAGWIGLWRFDAGSTIEIDVLGVATAGDTAPTSAGITGTGQAVLPALAAGGSVTLPGAWVPAFSDDFTGTDGSDPNPAEWTELSIGGAQVDIEGNRLHLFTPVLQSEFAEAKAEPTNVSPADVRLEYGVEIPPVSSGTADRFFHTVHVRHLGDESHYRIQIDRTDVDAPKAFMAKAGAGGGSGTPISTDFVLDAGETHYVVRFEALGSTLRFAVRPFGDGLPAEGTWDRQVADTDITAAGTVRFHLTKVAGDAADDRGTYVDNLVISEFVTGPRGTAVLPAANVAAQAAVLLAGSGTAAIPALGVRGDDAAFSDPFVAQDDSPPNAARWTVQESSGSTADLQSNRLRLLTGGPGSVGGFEDYARMIGQHAALTNCRVDFPIEIPDTLDEWFFLASLRGNGNWASDPTFPVFPQVGYWLQIASPHGTADDPVAFVGKADATGTTKVDLSAQDGLEVPDGVSSLLARFELTTEPGGVRVRASVRDAAAGPIPEGSWDIDVLDDIGTIFTGGGILQIGLGGSDGADQVRTVFLDHIVLRSTVASAVSGAGTATLPGLGLAGAAIVDEPPGETGSGTASLPALTVRGVQNDAIFNDDFVGDDGSAPDGTRWDTSGSTGVATVDLQGNRLHLFADASAGTSEALSVANVVLTDGRIDCEVEIPPAGGQDRFFLTIALRSPAASPGEGYFVHIFRSPEGDSPRWRLQKNDQNDDPANTPLSSDTTLSNAVLRYRVRLEVSGTTIRGSVRDFALGPIPEGVWDKTTTDSAFAGPGVARIKLTKLEGASDAYADRFQVFDLAQLPERLGTGAATLPALAASGTAIQGVPGPISGTGQATLPALTVVGRWNQAAFNLDDLLADFGWLLDPDDQGVTFRHLANMTSGYGYGADSPGEAFAYGNSGSGLLSETLNAIGGNNIDNIAVPLFAPLQLEDSPSNIFVRHADGRINLNLTARDFARIGWMLTNRGDWDGTQVVSQEFFAPLAEFGQSGSHFGHVQVPNTLPRTTASFTPGDYLDVAGFTTPPEDETPHGPGVFGLSWFLNGVAPGPVQQWPDLPADTMVTTGIFGTAVLIIIPSEGLVITVVDPTTTDSADVVGNIAPPSSVDPQFNDTVALIIDGITGAGLAPTFPGTTWTDITDAQAGIGAAALDNFIAAVTFSGNTRGVITRNGHMVRTFGNQTTPLAWASSRKAIFAVMVGTLAFGDVSAPWKPVLIDTFTGPNGSPPDSEHWSIVTDGDGTATAEIQNNELELFADTTGATEGTEAAVNSSPGTGALLNARIDFEFRFPVGSERCFANIRLRKGATDRYQLFLRRVSGAQSATIVKDTGAGGSEDLSTELSLDSSESHWRGRFQVIGTNPPQLKLAIRDFDDGPIAEGSWDREVADPGTTAFVNTPDPAELANAEGLGDNATAVQLDNVVIAELLPTEVGRFGTASLPALAVAALQNQAIFNADFVGEDGTAPDPVRWDTYGGGTFVVERQGNRLHMDATSGSTTGSSTANAVAKLAAPLTDVRVEYDVELPPAGPTGEFFSTMALRIPVHTGPQDPDYDAYRLFIRRLNPNDPPIVTIFKEIGGVGTQIAPASGVVGLSNSVLRYRVRFDVDGTDLRAAVRDFSLGPIPDDDWDMEGSDSELTNPGTVRQLHTKGDAAGSRPLFIDHVQIFDLAAPGPNQVIGSGGATLGAPAVASQAVSGSDGVGLAALPALDVAAAVSVDVRGQAIAALPAMAVAGSTATQVNGAGVAALRALLVTGASGVGTSGNGVAQLAALEALGQAGVVIAGTGVAALPGLRAAGVTAVAVRGAGAASLPALTVSAGSGLPVAGLGVVTLPAIQVSASSGLRLDGTGMARLPAVTVSGAIGLAVRGDGAVTLPALQVDALAAPELSGQGVATLPSLAVLGSTVLIVHGAGVLTLPSVSVDADATGIPHGVGMARLPALAASGASAVLITGDGVATLPALAPAGSTLVLLESSGIAVLPALGVSATGLVLPGVENFNMDVRATPVLALRVWATPVLDLDVRIEPEDD